MPRIAELEIGVATVGTQAARRDLARLETSTKATARSTERVGTSAAKASGGFGRSMRNMAVTVGGFYAVAKSYEFGKEVLNQAAQVQKFEQTVNHSFGKSAEAVNRFADGAAAKLGISKDAALQSASGFGLLFHNMGVGQKSAAEMTVKVEKLAGSLSMIKGTDPTRALKALNTTLVTGSTRGLRDFGVALGQAQVKEEALRLGLVKSTVDEGKVAAARLKLKEATEAAAVAFGKYGASSREGRKASIAAQLAQESLNSALAGTPQTITPAARAQAVYQLLIKQLPGYLDQAKKHSGDLANQEKVLHAQWENDQAVIGQALLPAVTKLVGGLSGLLGLQQQHTRAARIAAIAIGTLAAAFIGAKVASMVAESSLVKFITSERVAAAASRVLSATLWLVNTALDANPIGIVVIALAALAAGLVIAYTRSATFRRIVNSAFNSVKGVVGDVTGFIRHHWLDLISLIPGIGLPLRVAITHFNDLKRGVSEVVTGIEHLWGGLESKTEDAFSSMVSTAESWINRLLRAYNWVADHLPGIDSVPLLGTGGGGGHHVRTNTTRAGGHPRMAMGGIASASRGDGIYRHVPGGVMHIAEAGYDEAVVSLNPSHRDRSKKVIEEAALRLGIIPQFDLGGIAHSVGSAIAGAASSAASHVAGAATSFWDAISNPRQWILSHLPSIPGSIPQPVRGMLEDILRDLVGVGARQAHTGPIAAAAAEAARMTSLHRPYLWGGGHGSFSTQGPWDCSGAVSEVLHAAGLLSGSPEVSGALMSWGRAGHGPLEVLANPEHTYMIIDGRAFGTSSFNPGGGFGGPLPYGERGGFAVRTYDQGGYLPPGLSLAYNGTGKPEQVVRKAGTVVVHVHLPAGAERWNEKKIGEYLGRQLDEAM